MRIDGWLVVMPEQIRKFLGFAPAMSVWKDNNWALVQIPVVHARPSEKNHNLSTKVMLRIVLAVLGCSKVWQPASKCSHRSRGMRPLSAGAVEV